MKKSKVETAETRKRIISVASQLFLEKGLAETGVAEIMAAAGLTQGGFYRHFESKEQLIAEANRSANETLFDSYQAAIKDKEPGEAMLTISSLYLTQVEREDAKALCPLANLGSELRHSNEHIRTVAMEGYQRLVAAFTMLAKEMGIANHSCVAGAIVSTIVGAVTLSRLAVEPVMASDILENADFVVRALLTDT